MPPSGSAPSWEYPPGEQPPPFMPPSGPVPSWEYPPGEQLPPVVPPSGPVPSWEQPPSFQQGGVVPGAMGEPKLIRAEGGEIVIPNAVQSPYMKSLFGKTFIPQRETLGRFLTRPAKVQIPSMIGGDFRFRSPQTIRRMAPTQRRLFQEGIRAFGIPWEDFSMQEGLATGAGGPGRSRIQFRRPSFVRG